MTDPTFDPRVADKLRTYTQEAVASFDPHAIADAAVAARGGVRSWPDFRTLRQAAGRAPMWLAISLALALIVAGMVGGLVGGTRRGLTQTSTPPSGVIAQVASPTDTTGTCITDTVQVVARATMGRMGETLGDMPRLGRGQGVVITGAESAASDIWLIGGGGTSGEPIAQISGGARWLNVLGVSTRTSQALVRVGQYSGPDSSRECADLYLVALDGSEVRRLTAFGAGRYVLGGAISPDGTRVASAAWVGKDVVDVSVIDLTSGTTIQEPPGCTSGTWGTPITVSWSTETDRFAVACHRAVVYDATGATRPVVVGEDTQIGLGWDGGTLMVAVSSDGPHQNGIRVDAVDPTSGHIVRGPDAADSAIDWAIGSGIFAPSGRRLLAVGYVGSTEALYVIGASRGAPRAIASGSGAWWDASWSVDERSVIYPDFSARALKQIELASDSTTSLGALPADYITGLWRLP